ncbi:hypothetical protein [Rhodohalobacter sp.]
MKKKNWTLAGTDSRRYAARSEFNKPDSTHRICQRLDGKAIFD